MIHIIGTIIKIKNIKEMGKTQIWQRKRDFRPRYVQNELLGLN